MKERGEEEREERWEDGGEVVEDLKEKGQEGRRKKKESNEVVHLIDFIHISISSSASSYTLGVVYHPGGISQ